jgi:hypothetical protein
MTLSMKKIWRKKKMTNKFDPDTTI